MNTPSRDIANGVKPSFAKRVKHSDRHHTMTAKTLKLLLAISFVVIAVLIVFLAMIGNRLTKSGGSDATRAEAAAIVTDGSVKASSFHTVSSDFGYAYSFDSTMMSSTSQIPGAVPTDPNKSVDANGTAFKNEDLWSKKRPYIISEVAQISADTGKRDYTPPPYLRITANRNKAFWGDSATLPANQGKSKLDILAENEVLTYGSDANGKYQLIKTTDITISGNKFRRLDFQKKNEQYGITTYDSVIDYISVQFDRPIRVQVQGINSRNQGQAGLYDNVIKSLKFTAPKSDLLVKADSQSAIKLAATSTPSTTTDTDTTSLPEGTANVPNKLDPKTVLNVVAKNQPSVVRIGSVYCADMDLLMPDNSVGLAVKNGCSAGIGSGSFISKDGYIATNGHVAKFSADSVITGYALFPTDETIFRDRVVALLSYLIKSGVLTAADVQALLAGVQAKDPDAIAKLQSIGSLVPANRIKVGKETHSYSIQTSNDPLRLETAKDGVMTLTLSKTNIAAKLVDLDYEEKTIPGTELYDFDNGTGTDVALLKAEGTFPVVQLGGISKLKSGDLLTAIGYPYFVDGGLDTKEKQTVPSVTQGLIESIGMQSSKNAHQLIATSVPIASGNSGGPTLDANGNQIGINTYGAKGDCNDGNCFGNGVSRDIADLKALVEKDKITLQTDSPISKTWREGIDAFSKGDYTTAAKNFKAVQASYPANYLAPKFAELATSKLGTAEDISAAQNNFNLVIVLVGAIGTFIVIAGVGLTIFLVRGRHAPPAAAVAGYGPPQQPGQQQYAQQLPYAQQQAYSQQQQYAQQPVQQYPQQQQYVPQPPAQQYVPAQQATTPYVHSDPANNPYAQPAAQAPTPQIAAPQAPQQTTGYQMPNADGQYSQGNEQHRS